MRVGLYSPWDMSDPQSWSGVVLPMAKALSEALDVEVLPRLDVQDAARERVRTRIRGRFGRRSLPKHTMATARRRSAALRAVLDARTGPQLDAIVVIAGSTDVLDLPPGLPLIQVTDATFPAILGFYPLATGLGRRNESQGLRVERASAGGTSHFVVATEWAARSLEQAVGVEPARITVAPFGPAISAPSEPRAREPQRPLKVLAVISDWARKGGDDVVAAVEQARRNTDLELTVVGQAPEGLPPWVHAAGRVDRMRLAEVYAEHDVLIDLARANAAGVVLTDALTAGLPVVATNVGGVDSIVRDCETGWLVRRDSAVDDASHILSRLTAEQVRVASRAALEDARRRLTWSAWARGATAAVHQAVTESVGLADSNKEQRYPAPPPRMAMITPIVPSARSQEAAGEKLVSAVVDAMSDNLDITLISADGPANRRAIARGSLPPYILIKPTRHVTSWLLRALEMAPVLSQGDLEKAAGILRHAAVIDIQWEENAFLLPALRRMNRDARIVVTLHDVLSQRFERHRDLQSKLERKAVWEARRRVALGLERMIVRRADDVVVLSQKDADLLPASRRRARVYVIPPAIPGTLRAARAKGSRSASPRLLFVGFMARWANEEGMHWFVTEVLPRIRAVVPQARMAVAGGGLRDHVVAELQNSHVEVLGFVDDLDAVYRDADVVVVPLLSGAGVKFKVVEALVRGIPVVTTSVGNEGIRPADAAVVADDAEEFAKAVLRLIFDLPAAEAHARSEAVFVAEEYGVSRFRDRLVEVYL